jgi:sugar lactone lactonase YvrE
VAAKIAIACLLAACAAPQPEPSTVLISDYRANAIFRFDGVSGESLGTFAAGSEQRVDRPAGVRLGPSDQLYTAGFGRGEVVRYDLHSGAMMDIFYWDTALLEEPVELEFHGDDLVVLGNDTNNMVVIDPNGIATRTFGYPDIRRAHDFTIDHERVLVATESVIQVWDLASGTQLHEFGADHLAFATSIATDGETIYVADWELDRIVTFTTAGDYLGTLPNVVNDPISIDFGPDGELYVLDHDGLSRLGGDRLIESAGQLQYPRSFLFVR